jgi:hypothetical protein
MAAKGGFYDSSNNQQWAASFMLPSPSIEQVTHHPFPKNQWKILLVVA